MSKNKFGLVYQGAIIDNEAGKVNIHPVAYRKAIKAGVDIGFEEFLILDLGKYMISVALVFLVLIFIVRKSNKDCVYNESGNGYYDYSYGWYWFCNKILGYQKCSLVRVPISMQFKLLINQVFQEFTFGDENNYVHIDEEEIISHKKEGQNSVVNLVLADTHPIPEKLLPDVVSDYITILIARKNAGDGKRYISESFCNKVQETVYHLTQLGCKTINIFPTTNAAHNIRIVQSAFMKGGRGEIEHLYVFTQPNASKGDWIFSDVGLKIR